jgi:acid phosphatase
LAVQSASQESALIGKWLGAVALGAVAVAAVTMASCRRPPSAADRLGDVQHFVIIYEENHSFDNLYGGWEGVNGLGTADPDHTSQMSQRGAPYSCLLQLDVNLTSPPLEALCTGLDATGRMFSSRFTNRPFPLDLFIAPGATTCPAPGAFFENGILNGSGPGLPGGCTRDIVHRFYQEQYQLHGGHQDRYVTGSDAGGLTMGTYQTITLPIYQYLHAYQHPRYAIADNFFQGAFGGSFLNHQWLIAAATPVFAGADNTGGANDIHSVLDANGMPTNSYPLYRSPLGGAVQDNALTASCHPPAARPAVPAGLLCGDYAVNTIASWYQPYQPGTADPKRLPPLANPTIGDRLSAAHIDWAWYSGGWSNADGEVGAPGWTNGNGPGCADRNVLPAATYPNCPDGDFQFHHQPFNFFAAYAPGTEARRQHLRDEAEFQQLAASSTKTCILKPVSFIKPLGEENEHPGYASETRGSNHLVQLLKSIESSPCAKDTMVIVAYDEFGGQWDHVTPPGQGGMPGPHDTSGPGTRIPVLVLSPSLAGSFVVDSTERDTTSISATIEHRYKLEPLGSRDRTVSDLSSVFTAKPVGD